MKKFLSTMMVVLLCASAQAATPLTAKGRITIYALDGSNQIVSDVTDNVRMMARDSYTSLYDDGADTPKNPNEGLNVYAVGGDGNYSIYANNSLDNTYIGFKRVAAYTRYRMVFSMIDASLAPLYLYDLATNTTTLLTNNGQYDFEETALTDVVNRFVINPFFTVTTNTSGYATYSNSLDLVFASGQTGMAAYSAVYTPMGEDGQLNLTEQAGVNANTGVVIYGAPSTTYTLVPGTVADYTSELSASVTETTLDASKQHFCMATLNGLCAFYEYLGATVPANKAYLEIGATAAPRRIRMVVDQATGVESAPQAATCTKFVRDGQLYLLRDGVVYNMQGQIIY